MCAQYPNQWEYRSLKPPREETQKEASDPTTQLNELGKKGWEFVETIEYTGGGTKYLVLKRPLDPDTEPTDE
ncbi:DUF4177 domain-containing protein [Haladaptatus halobius]|uniref:DUF4177 domain-containing protein n=1 Tax=Haladaptatus halobius TaxID=2884875 RepID=UPI001D0B8940|nr:DUF4177 domain-containing protein [Haladaptatus halobius]